MAAIHLNMMELERYRQRGLEPSFAISGPDQERIVELSAILVDDAVNLCLHKGGCANNHVVFKEKALAFSRCLHCQHQVVVIELL